MIKMKKYIIVILSLLMGVGIGYFLAIIHIGHVTAKTMFMLQEKEISELGKSAYKAYLDESTKVGIWALEEYVNALNRIIKERSNSFKKRLFFIISPETELLLTHGRLMLLYKKINKPEKAKYHLKQALSFAKKSKLQIKTEQDLIDFLKNLDKQVTG